VTGLLDLLADGAHSHATLRCGEDQPVVTSDEIWRRSEASARWLARRFPPATSIGAFLTLTPDTVPAIVGAWRAGLTLVSLPLPGRRPDVAGYHSTIARIVRSLGISLILAEGTPPGPVAAATDDIEMLPFAATQQGGPTARARDPGDLVQFTSGSTRSPKGVRISLEALATNVGAIIDRFDLTDDVRCCSWLPLSHDMGLIATLFTPWAAFGLRYAGRGQIALSHPQSFQADPLSWMRDCSVQAANFTAVPNFALDWVSRTLSRQRDHRLDLRSLRRVAVGSEPISAGSLERFQAALEGAGLPAQALCPGYGMAEVGVGVSAVAPHETWRAAAVDAAQLSRHRWRPGPRGAARVVSLGRPLPGIEVRVDTGNRSGDPTATGGSVVGHLEVSAPSLLSEYIEPERTTPVAGWLRTPDLGYVDGSGEVFVTGRSQELLLVAGRNLYATDVERAAETVPFVRPGNCAAISDGRGRYAIIAETGEPASGHFDGAFFRRFRSTLVREVGVGPSEIVFVPRGSLSKTSSGKMRRYLVQRCYEGDEYDVVARCRFSWSAGPKTSPHGGVHGQT
jgi:acyl-CoA synthetase (AMP-forming)/AMP-acid ligase II